MLRKFIPYLKKYRWKAVFSPIMMILEVFCGLAIPYYMSVIVDDGLQKGNPEVVWRAGAIMFGLAFLGMIFGGISTYLGAFAGQGMAAEIRSQTFRKIQQFSFKNLDQFPTSTLITRLTSDSFMIGRLTQMALRAAVRAPVRLIGALIMAIMISKRLAVSFAVAIPLIIVISAVIMKMAGPRFTRLRKAVDALNRETQENLNTIREIKSFVREEEQTHRFEKAVRNYMESAMDAIKLVMKSGPLFMLIINGCMVAILWFGSKLVLGEALEIGKLASFLTYVGQILMSMMIAISIFLQFVFARTAAKRILEILELDIDITSPEDAVTEIKDGTVEFDHVTFSYPGMKEPILKDISFTVPAGHTLGILGSTGSAKTTLVQLIPRLYDTDSGSVSVGGVDVKDLDLQVLRDNVAMVLQYNTLFTGTIRSNLLWGDANATDDMLWKVLEIADAKDFVEAMPDGLDSLVEQGGTNFSGGQKQRLCIARALLTKPKVLIFDDSLSAVDMATERRIQARLAEALPDITTFVVAQRINSVAKADRILVMDRGAVESYGTHDELMEKSQIYQEVYESQMRGVLAQ